MTGKGDGSGLSFYGVCVGGKVGGSFLGWRAREFTSNSSENNCLSPRYPDVSWKISKA